MKPLMIEMSAFGSYAGREVVDFTSMQQGIFLITGDTGAGKTTIFDAMMYALYDDTSGGRREGAMMRSQYAKDDTPTYVKFTFSYRGKTYTIRRNPEYSRPGKRRYADGSIRMVKEIASVELMLEDGSVFMGKKRDTDKKIEEIIGLDAQQFRQVAMIAQGDFLKLLHAESKERKEIFSKIFHTRIYWRIQESLKVKTKNLYGQIADNLKQCQREINQVCCQENSLYGAQWKRCKKETEFSLDEILEILKKIVEEDSQSLKQLKKNRTENCEKISQLEELFRRFSLVQNCEKRTKENQEKLEGLCQWLQQQAPILGEYMEKMTEKQNALNLGERELTPQITRLQDSLKQYELLAKRRKELQQKQKDLVQIQKNLEQKAEEQKNLQTKRDALEDNLKELETLPVQKVQAETLWKQYQQQKKQLEEYCGRLETLADFERKKGESLAVYQSACEKARKESLFYEDAYRMFFEEQAGILAQHLEEGLPCPVCGSIHHPAKAELYTNAPTQEQVEQAKVRRNHAEQKRDEAQIFFMECAQKLQNQQDMLQEQGASLLEDDNFQLNMNGYDKINEKVDNVDNLVDKCAKDVDKIRKLELELKKRKQECALIEEKQEQQAQQQKRLAEKEQVLFVEEGKLEKEIQILQEKLAFADEKETIEELQKLQAELDVLRKESEQSRREYERKSEEHHIKSGEKNACEYQGQILLKELQEIKESYEQQQRICGKNEEDLAIEVFQEKLGQARVEQKELEKQYIALFNCAQNNKNALRKLEEYENTQGNLRKRYALYDDLSRTANGTLTGSAKVDFETYVQRQYFKQIIAAANRRLVKMNQEQFILQCRDLKNLSGKAQAGLDLDVYHLVNQSVRDVKTLSGGESFIAALAMALGLADMIQNEAGAIRLDTMFVDEGFGSLDDESLAQAIQVLLGLTEQQCLVGIISHVNQLKEQIDCKLIVTKNDKGSHVRWG